MNKKYFYTKITGLIAKLFGKRHSMGIDFSSDGGQSYTATTCYKFLGKLYIYPKKINR